jgi:hypothetical protein
MRRLLVSLSCLATTSLSAQPGVSPIAAFSGVFGVTDPPEENCATNPMTQVISPDHRRISFHWAIPVESYTGAMITDFGGRILASDKDSLTFLRDAETRLDAEGAPILWTMHLLPGGGYCYSSSGWPDEACGDSYLRCPVDAPIS